MVFGISIGSTTLSNAVVASGRAQVVANADGHHRPRAVVAKVENEFCVGTAALSARNTPLFKNILKEFIENGPTHMIQCQVNAMIRFEFNLIYFVSFSLSQKKRRLFYNCSQISSHFEGL